MDSRKLTLWSYVAVIAALIVLLFVIAGKSEANPAIITVEWVADDGSAARIIEFIDTNGDLKCDFGTYMVIQNSIVIHSEQLTCEEADIRAAAWVDTYGKTGFIPADEF